MLLEYVRSLSKARAWYGLVLVRRVLSGPKTLIALCPPQPTHQDGSFMGQYSMFDVKLFTQTWC